METKEKNFENDIEAYLLSHGYVKGNQDTYDKGKAIDMPVLISFIQATQPKMWQRYVNVYGEKAEKQERSCPGVQGDRRGVLCASGAGTPGT